MSKWNLSLGKDRVSYSPYLLYSKDTDGYLHDSDKVRLIVSYTSIMRMKC